MRVCNLFQPTLGVTVVECHRIREHDTAEVIGKIVVEIGVGQRESRRWLKPRPFMSRLTCLYGRRIVRLAETALENVPEVGGVISRPIGDSAIPPREQGHFRLEVREGVCQGTFGHSIPSSSAPYVNAMQSTLAVVAPVFLARI